MRCEQLPLLPTPWAQAVYLWAQFDRVRNLARREWRMESQIVVLLVDDDSNQFKPCTYLQKRESPALGRAFENFGLCAFPQAASSSTPSSEPPSSGGFGPRRGPLARAASISLIASVSVTR